MQTISLYSLLFSMFKKNARGAFRVKVLFVFHLAHEQKLGNQRFQIIYIRNLLCHIKKRVLPTTTLMRKMFVKITCNRYQFHPKLVWEISNVCITPLTTSNKILYPCSTTPFFFGVQKVENCLAISCDSQNS